MRNRPRRPAHFATRRARPRRRPKATDMTDAGKYFQSHNKSLDGYVRRRSSNSRQRGGKGPRCKRFSSRFRTAPSRRRFGKPWLVHAPGMWNWSKARTRRGVASWAGRTGFRTAASAPGQSGAGGLDHPQGNPRSHGPGWEAGSSPWYRRTIPSTLFCSPSWQPPYALQNPATAPLRVEFPPIPNRA